MRLTTWDPHKEKVVLVGNLVGTTLYRDVEAKHFMKILGGYGIQEVAFQTFIEKGGKYIVEKVIPTGDMWRATKEDWIRYGRVMDYGWGKQRFLSLKYMKKYTPKPNLDQQLTIHPETKIKLSELWKEVIDKKNKTE